MKRGLGLLLILGTVLFLSCGVHAQTDAHGRAEWMREARWGVMTHYLPRWIAEAMNEPMTPQRWNTLVDAIDVEKLADQLQEVGAGYFIVSLGQSDGYYLAPNATYDRFVGAQPSKCSRRDLVFELAEALEKRGIKLIVYLMSRAPRRDAEATAALSYEHPPGRNREFLLKWEAVIREWSERWGNKVAGWWFDSVYWPNAMHRHPEPPNFASFAAAARAGNPQSALAFNPGVVNRPISMDPEDDYIAGEVSDPTQWRLNPSSLNGYSDGAQIHVLTYLGRSWGHGPPRFDRGEEIEFSRRVREAQGVITWDVPARLDGTLDPEFLPALRAIGAALTP